MKYFFSIITPTYNSKKFLKRNIESVKNQTFQNFEHIFIDGFSNDGTVEMIKKYQREFGEEKIKLFQYPPKGVVDAFNKGIIHSNGKYLIHHCSDEFFYDREVLQKIYDFLTKYDYDWIYGMVNVVKDGQSLGIWPQKKIWQVGGNFLGKYLLNFYNFIPHASVFYKKEIFEKLGMFDEIYKPGFEVEFWLRIKDKTNWGFSNIIVANYEVHDNADSVKNRIKYNENVNLIRKKYLNSMEFLIYKFFSFLARFYRKY